MLKSNHQSCCITRGPYYRSQERLMKKHLLVIFPVLILLLSLCCASADAETIQYGKNTYDLDAVASDIGDKYISNFEEYYAFLDQFHHLQKVDMFATRIPKERVEEMAARYPDIEFGWTIHFAEHSFRTDMTAYSTLHVAKAKKHSDEYISLVRYCKNLRALDFGHNAVTDLSFLYDLPELRVLIISVNQVEDITPIASLKHLEYLEMFTNKVHDLSPLSGLTNLLDLNISWNYIDDLTPILGLKKLERLWTCRAINRDTATNLSKEQIAMLQEAIPGLDIFNGENPTGGTWRQHPRYTIVKRMFRTGVWEPFPESVPDDQT